MTTAIPASQRRPLRSMTALLSGFLAVVVLSLATDQLLHELHVYPPWDVPMRAVGLNLLALSYRIVYAIFGAYLTARLAPYRPMTHALIGAAIGQVLSLAGVVVAIAVADLGPKWYPIALAATAMPCAWLGGVIHRTTVKAG